ncbi:hypothetical protein HFP72_14510 [Nocardiopsis sp. ARC36]
MYILSILVTGVVVAGPVAAVGVVALVRARRAPRSPGTVRTAGALFLAAALLQAVGALLPRYSSPRGCLPTGTSCSAASRRWPSTSSTPCWSAGPSSCWSSP